MSNVWSTGVTFLGAVAVAIGCSGPDDAITVDSNALGIAEFRHEDDHAHGFELRAFNADGDEVASVRKRVGEIADLPPLPELGSQGAELVVTVNGSSHRLISRSTLFDLGSMDDPEVTRLFDIAEVADALRVREVVMPPPVAADGVPLNDAGSCYRDTGIILRSPVANECCYNYGDRRTLFVAASGANQGKLIDRWYNYGPCRTQSGGSNCTGQYNSATNPTGCFYGPNGYGAPQLKTVMSGGVWRVYVASGYRCEARAYLQPYPAPTLANVTGSFPTGMGCLNGVAVSSGGNAALGAWDY